MAAVTLAQLMSGIETRLATISGLNTADTVPGQITPPYAYVGVPEITEYWAAFGRGSWRPNPTITILVSSKAMGDDQVTLSTYADVTGANSIPLAIEGGRTLGLAGVDCIVKSFRPLGLEEVAVLGYYGGVFGLQVVAPGA